MYKGKQFRIRQVEEILAEINGIPERYRSNITRVFLADGDALVYPCDDLVTVLDALASTFPNLARVGSYASPNSLLTKTADQLAVLRQNGCVSSILGWSRDMIKRWR